MHHSMFIRCSSIYVNLTYDSIYRWYCTVTRGRGFQFINKELNVYA